MRDETNTGRKSTYFRFLEDLGRKRGRERLEIHLDGRGQISSDLGSPVSSREADVRVDSNGIGPWERFYQSKEGFAGKYFKNDKNGFGNGFLT